jgi:hypothetical protein
MFPDHRKAHQERMRDEHARSHGHLKRWHEQNPGFLDDPETYLTAHGMMTDEQARDLEAAGLLDRAKFRAQAGRDVRASEIHDKHLEARAHGVKGVRSADRLIEHVHNKLDERRRQPRHDDGTFAPRNE